MSEQAINYFFRNDWACKKVCYITMQSIHNQKIMSWISMEHFHCLKSSKNKVKHKLVSSAHWHFLAFIFNEFLYCYDSEENYWFDGRLWCKFFMTCILSSSFFHTDFLALFVYFHKSSHFYIIFRKWRNYLSKVDWKKINEKTINIAGL